MVVDAKVDDNKIYIAPLYHSTLRCYINFIIIIIIIIADLKSHSYSSFIIFYLVSQLLPTKINIVESGHGRKCRKDHNNSKYKVQCNILASGVMLNYTNSAQCK